MRIHHAQIMIPAGREDEARGFYEGLLRLTPVPRPPEMPDPGLWYRCGELELHLGIQKSAPDPESRAHVAFATADLDAVRARIEGADLETRDAAPLGGRRRFHARDPFGNRLEFLEEKNS